MVRLFSYRRCPFAIRTRIALFEKGVPFTVIEEDLKNKSDELRRLHPEARVPLLVHDGFVVFESSVITEYVDEAFEGPSLMPKSAREKSEVRMWTTWCNHLFKAEVDRFKYGQTPEIAAAAEKLILGYLKKLDDQVSASSSTSGWIVGTDFTLADIHLFPFVRQLDRVNSEILRRPEFARVHSWFQRISERTSVVQAMEKSLL